MTSAKASSNYMGPKINYEALDDEALVKAAKDGDMEAFEELVRRYSNLLYNRAMAFVREQDTALDISQEAWVRVWRGLRKFKGDCAFATWVTRIVTNLCIDYVRRLQRNRNLSIEALEEEIGGVERLVEPIEVDPLEGLTVEEQRLVLREALGQLTEVHRAVIILHEFENLSYKEIAKIMGCSLGTVMSRLFYARRSLAAAVREILRKRNEK